MAAAGVDGEPPANDGGDLLDGPGLNRADRNVVATRRWRLARGLAVVTAILAAALSVAHFEVTPLPPGVIGILLLALGQVAAVEGGHEHGAPWSRSDRLALAALIVSALSLAAMVVIGVITIAKMH